MKSKNEAATRNLLNFDLSHGEAGSLAGMDEAGRGPLAGPVVAACVVMPMEEAIPGINDSKKLTAKRRDVLYDEIIQKALAWGVGIVDEKSIDQINILQATKRAMEQAWQAMGVEPETLLVDSVKGLRISAQILPMDKGDATSYHIAAASIVAKVTRDRLMQQYALEYPEYHFEKHMGYGTALHLQALAEYGPCPIHRRSFLKNLKADAAAAGKAGEDWATLYLAARGWGIETLNYKTREGEIDIIARDPRGTVVFAEVKTRKQGGASLPREAVDAAKQGKIIRAALQYISEQPSAQIQYRFDVLEIFYDEKGHEVLHLRDAFRPEGGNYVV
ncbi:MAG: ribonuclease HII [Eubacteriales bacterium]|nr:ribonuclease HII [Eubacteriales bacterium]